MSCCRPGFYYLQEIEIHHSWLNHNGMERWFIGPKDKNVSGPRKIQNWELVGCQKLRGYVLSPAFISVSEYLCSFFFFWGVPPVVLSTCGIKDRLPQLLKFIFQPYEPRLSPLIPLSQTKPPWKELFWPKLAQESLIQSTMTRSQGPIRHKQLLGATLYRWQ